MCPKRLSSGGSESLIICDLEFAIMSKVRSFRQPRRHLQRNWSRGRGRRSLPQVPAGTEEKKKLNMQIIIHIYLGYYIFNYLDSCCKIWAITFAYSLQDLPSVFQLLSRAFQPPTSAPSPSPQCYRIPQRSCHRPSQVCQQRTRRVCQ